METFVYRSRIAAPAAEVFAWHTRPGALERLTPPWERVRVLSRTGGIRDGERVTLQVKAGPVPITWEVEHRDYVEGRQFRDVQISGPFAKWNHLHLFTPEGADGCVMEDRIEYALPLHLLSSPLAGKAVRKRLERMFRYRHATLIADLQAHHRYREYGPKRVLVSAASGLLGSALCAYLTTGGHEVTRLVRRQPDPAEKEIFWDPAEGLINADDLEDFDAVVHLSGENIATGHWNAARKQRIWSSRVDSTRLLCDALAKTKHPPQVVVCASGSGYYGNGGDRSLTEDSPAGRDCFFVNLVREWEGATQPAAEAGIRVVNTRIGVVLTPAGGALQAMLPAFKLGLGASTGTWQYTGWLSLDDLIGIILHAIFTENLSGPVNAVSPTPVTQRELAKTIGGVLHKPAPFSVPSFVIRFIFSPQLAEAMAWTQKLVPQKLQNSGYTFRHPDLHAALRHLLGY
ncbi:MAG: TIGR01777 family oxidoreductase [Calditrichota bacterium]